MSTTWKTKATLSAACAVPFGILLFLFYRWQYPDGNNRFVFWSIPAVGLVLFVYLLIHEKILQKKQNKVKAELTSPVIFCINGNTNLAGRVRNCVVYFCRDNIVLATLDGRPSIIVSLPRQDIAFWRLGEYHIELACLDDRNYQITTPQIELVRAIIQSGSWPT